MSELSSPPEQLAENNPLATLAQLMQEVARQPGNAALWCRIGFTYLRIGEHQEALATFMAAQQISPDYAESWFGEAVTRFELGEHQTALDKLGTSISRAPRDQRLWSARAHMLSALGSPPETILAAYKDWARRFAEPLKPATPPPPFQQGQRLRIGYLSADFRQHALAYFFLPVLQQHDKAHFELFGVFSGKEDQKTAEFKSLFEHWHDIANLDDAAASKLISELELDLLVDLSGHSDGNRLLTLARQPVAKQATWYGYNCTTGMSAMQYRLTDIHMDPTENAAWSTETLLRLPCFASYQPPEAPEISDLPAKRNGYVTFGSLNNPQKLTKETLTLWARILDALPNSRLLLIAPYGSTGESSTRGQWQQHLQACGLPLERIDLLPKQGFQDFLALSEKIDIALEPFPFSGGVTTCHTLWMGLPAITLTGTLPFERAATAILQAARLPELIQNTPAAYLEMALKLAQNLDDLAALRKNMRPHLLASPLLDSGTQTRALEEIYRGILA